MRTILALPFLIGATLTLASCSSAQDLLGVAWSGATFRIDATTGAALQIGNGLPGQNALARDGAGNFWSTAQTGSVPAYGLTILDPVLGTATLIYSPTSDIRGLAGTSSTVLLGIRQAAVDQLIAIDTTNGTETTIGNTGMTAIQALCMHQGICYAWDVNLGLATISLTTGLAIDVNPAVGSPAGGGIAPVQFLTSHPDGRLLGGSNDLYVIDPASGIATLVGAIGNNIDLRGAEPLGGGFIAQFGQACAGPLGQPALNVTGTPLPGNALTAASGPHSSGAPGFLVFGLSRTSHRGSSLPLLLDPILGSAGCFLNVSIDNDLLGFVGSPAPTAMLTFNLGLPARAAGLRFHLQHVVLEPVPGGMAWTNGVTVQVGP